ncbi:MAG: methyltransferase domain-containing protein [Actinobacteria bacterium]|nr:methyltransferase domain-containing protein [Actinomycetota bacterium]
MDDQSKKALLRETFDTVAEGYDGEALRFFPNSATLLADHLDLGGGEHVLDVATGTGHAAFAIARRLPEGRVTGVDFAGGMIEQAQLKATDMHVSNVEFIEMDMQSLEFPDGSFDAAVCSFGIFFVEDMAGQLAHMASKVRAGGKVAISGFQENLFQPLTGMFNQRLKRYGVEPPEPGWKRIASEEGCRHLFGSAGIEDVWIEMDNVGYFLDSTDEWWDIIWNAGFRRLVDQMTDEDRERFRTEHLQEVGALRTADGIKLEVGVIYAVGMKP